jgi:hypothetical protein
MNIYDFVGEEINEPIQSNNGVGDLRRLCMAQSAKTTLEEPNLAQ